MMRLSATPSPRSCSREGSITGDSITPLAFSQVRFLSDDETTR